jgi:hypothetical protein
MLPVRPVYEWHQNDRRGISGFVPPCAGGRWLQQDYGVDTHARHEPLRAVEKWGIAKPLYFYVFLANSKQQELEER